MKLNKKGIVIVTVIMLILSGKMAQMLYFNNNFKEMLFKFIEKYLEDFDKDQDGV
jgi:hypothetical protein